MIVSYIRKIMFIAFRFIYRLAMSKANSKLSTANIIFECKQHSVIIIKKLQNDENELYDTVLKAGSGQNCINIKAHKIVLFALRNELLMLSENELMDLLFDNSPHGVFEENVLLSVVKWVNFDKSNRKDLILQLLSNVGYQDLTPGFIVENIATVCKSIEVYELIFSWLRWHFAPLKTQRNMCDKLAVIQTSDTSQIRIQTYNMEVNSWSIAKQIPLWKDKMCFSTIVIDDKLFVVGGKDRDDCRTNSVECLNLNNFEWTSLPPMKNSRCFCHLADLKGYLCVYDGFDSEDFENSVEIYNFSTHQWLEIEPEKPTKMAQIAAHDGILYILDLYNTYLQCYNVSSNQWTRTQIEKLYLGDFGFVAVEGYLYVIGGKLETNVKRYNLYNKSWDFAAPLAYPYKYIKSTVFENKILICAVGSNGLAVVEEYNPERNTWTTLNPIATGGSFKTSLIFTLSGKIQFN